MNVNLNSRSYANPCMLQTQKFKSSKLQNPQVQNPSFSGGGMKKGLTVTAILVSALASFVGAGAAVRNKICVKGDESAFIQNMTKLFQRTHIWKADIPKCK